MSLRNHVILSFKSAHGPAVSLSHWLVSAAHLKLRDGANQEQRPLLSGGPAGTCVA
jgi:hypothetical protein